MDEMLQEFLGKVRIHPRTLDLLLEHCKAAQQTNGAAIEARRNALRHAIDICQRSLTNVTALRIRDLIPDGEFVAQREALQREAIQAEQNLKILDEHDSWLVPTQEVFLFCSKAVELYLTGDDTIKCRIVKTLGSNATLIDKKLNIEPKKPLFKCASTRSSYALRAVVEDVRTAWYAHDPSIMEILDCIRTSSSGYLLIGWRIFLLRQRLK